MVTNLLEHHWRKVWWINVLQIFLQTTYLALMWKTQSNYVVGTMLFQLLITEISLVIEMGADYFI